MDILSYILFFLLLVVAQSLFINGLMICFEKGMIMEWWPAFIKRVIKNEYWHKPLFSCIRCMASVYGFITFWPAILYWFGFNWLQIPVFVVDVFSLVFVNFYLYKKV